MIQEQHKLVLFFLMSVSVVFGQTEPDDHEWESITEERLLNPEDGDWMSRVNLHKISMAEPKEILSYVGLLDMTYLSLVKKWHRIS